MAETKKARPGTGKARRDHLEEARARILDAALPNVAFDGWTPRLLRDAAAQAGISAGEARLAAYLGSRIGTEAEVLMEKPGVGRTEHFAPIALDTDVAPGTILRARVTGAGADQLTGQPVDIRTAA